MNEDERWENVCKPQFDRANAADARLESKLDQIIVLLKGKGAESGLCVRVRVVEGALIPHLEQRLGNLESFQKRGVWGLIVVGGAFLAQFGVWLWTTIVGP